MSFSADPKYISTNSAIKEVEVKLEILKESDKTIIKYPNDGWFKIVPNKLSDISLTSFPEGIYTITYQLNEMTSTKTFFIRSKVYDFPCSECGKDLTITADVFKQIFPNAKNKFNNPEIVDAFNAAFIKANFKTCNHIAHFLAQVKHESDGMTAGTEGANYYLHRMLEVFRKNATTQFWYKQDFWDNKTYLNFVSKRVYEKMETETYDYIVNDIDFETWSNTNNALTSIKMPKDYAAHSAPHAVAFDGYTLKMGKGNYKATILTDVQKKNNAIRVLNVAYASSGLGNSTDTLMANADGYKYRGRGPIQVTGKAQYIQAKNRCTTFGLSYDFETDPDLMGNDVPGIWASMAWFMENIKIIDLDSENPDIITAKVNKASTGATERRLFYTELRDNQFKCVKH